MNKTAIIVLLLLLPLLIYAQRYDNIAMLCPTQASMGQSIPIELRFYKQGHPVYIDTIVSLSNTGATSKNVRIRKGLGSTSFICNSNTDAVISIEGTGFSKIILNNEISPTDLIGYYEQDLILEEDKCYRVTGNLNIGNNYRLIIEPGVRISIAEKANITIMGYAVCHGTFEKPIVFNSIESGKFWGGIMLGTNSDTSFFSNTFFVQGGGDTDFIFGHSQSQAVVKAEYCPVVFEACCFIDNTGKALGAFQAYVKLNSCLIARCDTGGEFYASKIFADSCHVMFIPDEDGIVNDDDNDAWYFSEVHSSGETSHVRNSFFLEGEDDGIDHNGAKLIVENCFFEGFNHEGIACSNKNTVELINTVITGCEQGIECGYGNAKVMVKHCLIINNTVGARFGDEYSTPSAGRLEIENTVFFHNNDNLLNYDPQLQAPVGDSLKVCYSITNDPDFDNQSHCINAIPIFNTDLTLHSSSPGAGAGNDGLNMGLISSFQFINHGTYSMLAAVFPNPASELIYIALPIEITGYYSIRLHDLSQQLIRIWQRQFFANGIPVKLSLSELPKGMYIISIETESNTYFRKIVLND